MVTCVVFGIAVVVVCWCMCMLCSCCIDVNKVAPVLLRKASQLVLTVQASFTQKYTLYGIRYMLYDLLSATGDIQVMQRGSSGISSVAESKTYSVYRMPYSIYFYVNGALQCNKCWNLYYRLYKYKLTMKKEIATQCVWQFLDGSIQQLQ